MRPFGLLARFAHRFFEGALALAQGRRVPEAGLVQAHILSQLSHQVRLVELAAERGYSLQAAANVATAYELAGAVGFIAADSTRATQWLAHSDTRRSCPSANQRASTIRSLLDVGGTEAARLDSEVAAWEKRYEFYCMAKHGNPRLLNRYGFRRENERTITLYHGPIAGPFYDTLAQFSVFRAAQLLVYAVPVFGRPLLDAADSEPAARYVRQMRRAPRYLSAAARALPQRVGAA